VSECSNHHVIDLALFAAAQLHPTRPPAHTRKLVADLAGLTPFRVKQISTTLDEYIYTPDDMVVDGEVESGRLYQEKDFNKIIEIKEREAHRVKLFMEQIDQKQKTLVFCASQDHALVVRDLINQTKRSADPNYCQRVTAKDGELGDEYLREFQDNEKTIPTILTTSQKLSTGVDARNVRNIVLMRSVNSMIEFKQIIGRGTRRYDGKDYFTIYDFVKAYRHFSDPEWDGEPQEPEPCSTCGGYPCECVKTPAAPCADCGRRPCECLQEEAIIDPVLERVHIERLPKIGVGVCVLLPLWCGGQAQLNCWGEVFEDVAPRTLIVRAAAMAFVNDDQVEEVGRVLTEVG
jgi:hypothetical protein